MQVPLARARAARAASGSSCSRRRPSGDGRDRLRRVTVVCRLPGVVGSRWETAA